MAYQQERKYYTSLLALLAAKNTTTWKRTAPTKIMACLCAGPNRFSHIPPLPVVLKLIKIRCLVIWFWLTAKPPLHCPGLGKLVSPRCLPWCSLQKSRGTCRSESAHRPRPREGWDQGTLWRSAYLQTRQVHSKCTGIPSKTYCSSLMSTYIKSISFYMKTTWIATHTPTWLYWCLHTAHMPLCVCMHVCVRVCVC